MQLKTVIEKYWPVLILEIVAAWSFVDSKLVQSLQTLIEVI